MEGGGGREEEGGRRREEPKTLTLCDMFMVTLKLCPSPYPHMSIQVCVCVCVWWGCCVYMCKVYYKVYIELTRAHTMR